ncbi:tautomerase family protein [Streptomyces sp. B1866]|uniref:tautomerase family protein n=1 Tax=Streptomyces sp. B1866 TaxID=3075431 RepID=UPI002891939E|nr:tautomerase family protein [Streptomyces sp. B1866]MDT3399128.1 tautomerase family protein [Streptomyces sp. B1866]
MPHLTVHLHEEELDGTAEARLIRTLADAMAAVYGEWARAAAVVELFGVPRRRWGRGGVAGADHAPVVTLNMRERALNLPEVPDAPARLIEAVTDALTGVFGEGVRERVAVLVVGVPEGRSGVAGQPV